MTGSGRNSTWTPGPRTHRVRLGDTLSQLAVTYGVSLEALIDLNRIRDARLLWVGQVLVLPEGRAAVDGTSAKREPEGATGRAVASREPGDEEGNELGVVCWRGTPAVRLRSSASTQDHNVIGELAFSTLLQVVKPHVGGWLQVTTLDGRMGYVSAEYVWRKPLHPLPEPGARLHCVSPGAPGTAIAIAEKHFANPRWGQDLRFYVALLALVNKRVIPSGTSGWKKLYFQEGEIIWVPSQEFAETMRGLISSGSSTYEFSSHLRLVHALERLDQLQSDLREAIRRAVRHIGPAIQRHVEESIVSILSSLLLMAVGAMLLLALSTLIGAALGFIFGAGAGAAPGAAAGFKVGLALMEWLGLAFLVKWVANSVVRIGSAFATFFISVSGAHGDSQKLENAALQLAEALGLCLGIIVEALVMWAAARGAAAALTQLKGTAFAKAFGESHLGTWLRKRVGEYKDGKSKLPGPNGTVRRAQAHALARDLGINPLTADALLQASDAVTIRGLKEDLGADGINLLAIRPHVLRQALFAALKQAEADATARASVKEALRLNEKGTLSNTALQTALHAYLAFSKRHGKRVSGDFLSRFWRVHATSRFDKPQALAELRLADDLLSGDTPLGSVIRIKALAESTTLGEKMPEFRVETATGSRLVENKLIGEPNKPLQGTSVTNNAKAAHQQLRDEFKRSGETNGLIRLDAREAGNTSVSAHQLADWVSSRCPNPRDSHAARWVEIFYRNSSGQLIQVVLELKSGRFEVHSERAIE